MKISARNALPGKVVAITPGTAHVKIEIAEGALFTATITDEAVKALDLEAGKAAIAILKA